MGLVNGTLVVGVLADFQKTFQLFSGAREWQGDGINAALMSMLCAIAAGVAVGVMTAKNLEDVSLLPPSKTRMSEVLETLQNVATRELPSGLTIPTNVISVLVQYALHDSSNPVVPDLIGAAMLMALATTIQKQVQKVWENRLQPGAEEREKEALNIFLEESGEAVDEITKKMAEMLLEPSYSDPYKLTVANLKSARERISSTTSSAASKHEGSITKTAEEILAEACVKELEVEAKKILKRRGMLFAAIQDGDKLCFLVPKESDLGLTRAKLVSSTDYSITHAQRQQNLKACEEMGAKQEEGVETTINIVKYVIEQELKRAKSATPSTAATKTKETKVAPGSGLEKTCTIS